MSNQDLNDKVIVAKTALFEALGENVGQYLNNMKLWFRNKWTKEEFDAECRKLLVASNIHLHNRFLIAMLNKIDTFKSPSSSPTIQKSHSKTEEFTRTTKHKRKRNRTESDCVLFEPYGYLDLIAEDTITKIRPPPTFDEVNNSLPPTLRFCAKELFLPDTGFIMGRFLVGSWEVGLDNVDDVVAEYVSMAVRIFLKNLISVVIMKKKHYKCTGEGSFFYDVGAHLKDPTLRNTVTRQKIDDGPLELDKEITSPNFMRRPLDDGVFISACEDMFPQTNDVLTLRDLQLALVDHNVIASHTVYSLNMERLTQLIH